MVYYPDLATIIDGPDGALTRTVGWLEADHPYATGSVAPEFARILAEHTADPWQNAYACGPHFCSLCPPDRRHGSSRDVCIPTADLCYLAPATVHHYVVAHRYLPPAEFIDAVLACPPQGSAEFHRLLAGKLPPLPTGASFR